MIILKDLKELFKKSIDENIADKNKILNNILEVIREEESGEWVKNNLPVLLLLLIKRADNYGNGLVKEVNIIASKRLNNKEGNIYPALHALEGNGLISAYWVNEDGLDKKYYRLTRKGKGYLEEKEKIVIDIKNDNMLINKEALICP